jgi:hypothetical protein
LPPKQSFHRISGSYLPLEPGRIGAVIQRQEVARFSLQSLANPLDFYENFRFRRPIPQISPLNTNPYKKEMQL